jgi:hypothetical protein
VKECADTASFTWISFVLAVIVVIGVIVQIYLIASWVFGESGGRAPCLTPSRAPSPASVGGFQDLRQVQVKAG